jgi:hypothetical protein
MTLRRARLGPGAPRLSEECNEGHTVVEVILALLLFSVVASALSLVLVAQHRFYTIQAQVASTRDAARLAVEVLAGELRDSSPSSGDLYAIGPDSVALRSTLGLGVVCAVSANTVSLWRLTGTFASLNTDSALVFEEHQLDSSLDDRWTAARILNVQVGGTGLCPNGHPPTSTLSLDRAVTGATVGSPLRGFRPYVYKLYRSRDGNWWLGQRLRRGRIQPVAGPFASPVDGGLRLEYLTDTGAVTTDPGRVASVRIAVKAVSVRPVYRGRRADFVTDTLSTSVYLRNS